MPVGLLSSLGWLSHSQLRWVAFPAFAGCRGLGASPVSANSSCIIILTILFIFLPSCVGRLSSDIHLAMLCVVCFHSLCLVRNFLLRHRSHEGCMYLLPLFGRVLCRLGLGAPEAYAGLFFLPLSGPRLVIIAHQPSKGLLCFRGP